MINFRKKINSLFLCLSLITEARNNRFVRKNINQTQMNMEMNSLMVASKLMNETNGKVVLSGSTKPSKDITCDIELSAGSEKSDIQISLDLTRLFSSEKHNHTFYEKNTLLQRNKTPITTQTMLNTVIISQDQFNQYKVYNFNHSHIGKIINTFSFLVRNKNWSFTLGNKTTTSVYNTTTKKSTGSNLIKSETATTLGEEGKNTFSSISYGMSRKMSFFELKLFSEVYHYYTGIDLPNAINASSLLLSYTENTSKDSTGGVQIYANPTAEKEHILLNVNENDNYYLEILPSIYWIFSDTQLDLGFHADYSTDTAQNYAFKFNKVLGSFNHKIMKNTTKGSSYTFSFSGKYNLGKNLKDLYSQYLSELQKYNLDTQENLDKNVNFFKISQFSELNSSEKLAKMARFIFNMSIKYEMKINTNTKLEMKVSLPVIYLMLGKTGLEMLKLSFSNFNPFERSLFYIYNLLAISGKLQFTMRENKEHKIAFNYI